MRLSPSRCSSLRSSAAPGEKARKCALKVNAPSPRRGPPKQRRTSRKETPYVPMCRWTPRSSAGTRKRCRRRRRGGRSRNSCGGQRPSGASRSPSSNASIEGSRLLVLRQGTRRVFASSYEASMTASGRREKSRPRSAAAKKFLGPSSRNTDGPLCGATRLPRLTAFRSAGARAERSGALLSLPFQIFAQEAEQHAVYPLVVPPVGLALDSLAHESGPLGVLNRALIEAIDLELQPVIAEVEEEVALKDPRSVVGKAPPAKGRMDGEPAEVRDPAAAVREVETHDARSAPLAVLFDLDHESPALLWLFARALDLLEHRIPLTRADGCEVRIDVVVRRKLEQEVDVVRGRAP